MIAAVRSCAVLLAGWSAVSTGLAAPTGLATLPVPDARPAVNPELAADGRGHFLLVWQQGRNYFEQQESDIYALRLDGDGLALGPPIPVCVAKGGQERPRVVFADGAFIVVWHDLRNARDWDVYSARIDADGTVRDPDGFLLAGGPANQAAPAIAAAPHGAVVLWQHYAGRHYQVHGAFVSVAGKPGPSRALTFGGETLHGGDLAIAGLGERWLMAWRDERKWGLGEAGGMITRFYARLGLQGGSPEVRQVERAPAVILGREGGRFVSDGDRTALYAGWGVIGRGRLIPAGAMFAADSAEVRPNPNAEPMLALSGWDPRRAITLFSNALSVEGSVAAAFGEGIFLVAARQAGSTQPRSPNRILGARLSPAGVRHDGPDNLPVLHEADVPIANPVLAAGPGGFMLVFEQDDAADNRRLFAKKVSFR